MKIWHLTYAARGRGALFPNERDRRRAVHALARIAGSELVLFCIVEDHIHLVVLADRERVGHLGRNVLLALTPLSAAPIEPAHRRPVEGRSHLEWLVKYCLIQPAKHDLGVHPALWSGSCFVDLVGARMVPDLRLRIGDALPRLRTHSLFAHVGLPQSPLVPIADDRLRSLGAARMALAASAALAVDAQLAGKDPSTVRARVAAAQLARAAGLPTSEISWALKLTRQAVARISKRPVDAQAIETVRLRLALEEAVASSDRVGLERPGLVREPSFPYEDE